jgi:hypothetical protein
MSRSWPATSSSNNRDFIHLKEYVVKNYILILCCIIVVTMTGCETVRKAGETTGAAIGETMNTVGSVTEGGAEAVQGKTTPEENPYNR